jgi:hypothetical protein
VTGLKYVLPVLCLSCALHASVLTFDGALSGANENPAVASPGNGFVTVAIDTVANTITFDVSFFDLTTPDTAAHIHCCIAQGQNTGVATALPALAGFPLTVTSGFFSNSFDLFDPNIYNPAFVSANGGTVAGAADALVSGMEADETYFNIHTGNFPGGEIRAFLVETPEPSTFLLAGLVLIALGIRRVRSDEETYPPRE